MRSPGQCPERHTLPPDSDPGGGAEPAGSAGPGGVRSITATLLVVCGLAVAGPSGAVVQPGDAAPDFTLQDVHDTTYRLQDFRGQVVLLDFIGYSCSPCIVAAPAVEALWHEYRDAGLQVLALDFWNGTALDVQTFLDQTGVTFPVLRDAGYLSLASQYGLGYDNFVVVDATGIVRYTSENEAFGAFNEQAIRNAIEQAFPTPVEHTSWATIKGLYR